MDRDDWFGLFVSVVLHVVVLFGLSVMTVAAVEEPTMGFIEVDFGSFSEGRPVSQAPVRQPTPPQPEPEEPVEEESPQSPPEEAQPVELPEATAEAPETILEPETEVISPAAQEDNQEEEEAEEVVPEETIRPLGSGDPEGETGPEEGDDGTAAEDTRMAPFLIEGLNRQAVQTLLPSYTELVNAVIRVRITVAPSGRIVRRIPLIKGNPALEQAVMDALLNWHFNPLPPNAPQENQTGVVTFRFQLR